MAKKVKRKVSAQPRQNGSAVAEPVYEEVAAEESPVAPVVPGSPRAVSRRPAVTEFKPDYGYIISDLKRIGAMAGGFVVLLVVLSFFLK